MKTSDAYASLLRVGTPVLGIREASERLGLSSKRTTLHLRSLERAGLVRRIQPGVWALGTRIDPLVLPAYVADPFPAYVSVWSALRFHGMIEQIPRGTWAVTTGRTRHVQTALGLVELCHITPDLFGGFGGTLEQGFVATPEKALFDLVYLRAPAGGGTRLPELELPAAFDHDELQTWIERINSPRLRTLVRRGIERAISTAACSDG